MSSAAGGFCCGAGAAGSGGNGADHHQLLFHGHGHDHDHGGGGQVYHVPQHSRREKLRFPHDAGDLLPAAAPPGPPAFYSYASSSSSSYSPHSPTLAQAQAHAHAHAQLVAHGLISPQIASQNFSLSLSSSSSNPPPPPPPPPASRRFGGGGPGAGPYGPFTGYAAVLGRSRFLGPAQKLLEEICDVGRGGGGVDRSPADDGLLDPDPIEAAAVDAVDHDMDGGDRAEGQVSGAEQQWKKTRLISMMEEVCKRYRQYCQQIQAVISSFETVAGLSNAAPYAATALKVMAKHFKSLKGMILNQLRNTSKTIGKEGLGKDDIARFGLVGGSACLQRANNLNNFGQAHNIWRPQRGLPERAVSVLRAWLFEHFLHPYPTDTDKQMLAKQTGLTRNQVSNWFINARVRLWKPMVEEIHNLEMRQLQKYSALDKNQRDIQQTQHSSDCSGNPSDSQPGQSSSITRNHNIPTSRNIQDELSQMSNSIQGAPINFPYNGLSGHNNVTSDHHQQVQFGVGGGNTGVSLTLGLHQNNRVCLAEPLPPTLPPNLAHRFGLEDVNDAYVMGSFEGQDRHFAKEIGGHLLHDFVG